MVIYICEKCNYTYCNKCDTILDHYYTVKEPSNNYSDFVIDKKVRKFKIPAVVCRSKSGGAHIFFFFDKWMEAADFRDKAAEIAAALGHGRCEIFPKQEQVLVERGDVGNFINLPYFDVEKTLRFAYWKEKSKYVEATLQQFIDRIHKIKCDPNKFMELSVGGKPNLYPGYVPCLKSLLSMGVFEGGGNKAAFQLGVFLQKSAPNNWKSQLEEINVKRFTPPLPASEIVTIFPNDFDIFFPCPSTTKPWVSKALYGAFPFNMQLVNSEE